MAAIVQTIHRHPLRVPINIDGKLQTLLDCRVMPHTKVARCDEFSMICCQLETVRTSVGSESGACHKAWTVSNAEKVAKSAEVWHHYPVHGGGQRFLVTRHTPDTPSVEVVMLANNGGHDSTPTSAKPSFGLSLDAIIFRRWFFRSSVARTSLQLT
ncbi:leukocyte immunoglobulin-like receptor [Anopheles sinensis]|uniref:Leukocyte immunoglobulin-like receptor n=1 Tax=Anopheles sinensis TaxID=74873 RepID=A0A084WSV7_ANOSI|nr:leukocyte immunoglobulin-like receptor [Anopheles sinensis]